MFKKLKRWIRNEATVELLLEHVSKDKEHILKLQTDIIRSYEAIIQLQEELKAVKAELNNVNHEISGEIRSVRHDMASVLLEAGIKYQVTSSIADTMEYGYGMTPSGFFDFPLTEEQVESHKRWKEEQERWAADENEDK